MIHTETVTIKGKQYRRTYSDTNMLLRDGIEYSEAIDPIDSDREYTESRTPLVESDELLAEEALDIILGGENA